MQRVSGLRRFFFWRCDRLGKSIRSLSLAAEGGARLTAVVGARVGSRRRRPRTRANRRALDGTRDSWDLPGELVVEGDHLEVDDSGETGGWVELRAVGCERLKYDVQVDRNLLHSGRTPGHDAQ